MTGRNPYNHLAERKAAPKRLRLELTRNLFARINRRFSPRLIRGTQTSDIFQQHEPVNRRKQTKGRQERKSSERSKKISGNQKG